MGVEMLFTSEDCADFQNQWTTTLLWPSALQMNVVIFVSLLFIQNINLIYLLLILVKKLIHFCRLEVLRKSSMIEEPNDSEVRIGGSYEVICIVSVDSALG